MALIDSLVAPSRPAACFLWPSLDAAAQNLNNAGNRLAMSTVSTGAANAAAFSKASNALTAVFKERLDFQYWPATLQDDYQPEYTEHMIPGGTHPLYQWIGGRGRTITFQAVFTSEINTEHTLFGGASAPDLTPSRLYTVDVVAALSRLRAWMLPKYGEGGSLGTTAPPQILKLSFGNTGLAGDGDIINVILRNAPVTYEAWFPNGQPRVATVDLTFNEIVQHAANGGSDRASVRFLDRTKFTDRGSSYVNRGNGSALNPLIGGL